MKGKSFLGLECISSANVKVLSCPSGLSGAGSKTPYQIIQERIFDSIETYDKMWVQSWAVAKAVKPVNYKTKHEYSGLNNFFLGNYLYITQKFENPFFVTYNQAKQLGGQVKQGAKGIPIFYWSDSGKGTKKVKIDSKTGKPADSDTDEADIKVEDKKYKYQFLKYYIVFHASDVEGVEWKNLDKYQPRFRSDAEKIDTVERIISGMPSAPQIVFEKPDAFYIPSKDIVNMPKQELFSSDQEYYGTLLHELVHSTGHQKRLDRLKPAKFGDKNYSFEELVAEVGAAFLCGEAGILNFTFENSKAYLKGWIGVLKKHISDDKNFIIKAARQAEIAADYILDKKVEADPVKEEAKTPTAETCTEVSFKVLHNKSKGGIEVQFDEKPGKAYTETLKELGFRWNPKTGLWYAPFTPEKLQSAKKSVQKVLSGLGGAPKGATHGESKEVHFIKRFLDLHNKVTPVGAILKLATALQGAIRSKDISKNSPFSKCIMEIQTKLVNGYNTAIELALSEFKVEISPKDRNRYTKLIQSAGLGGFDEEGETKLVYVYKGHTIKVSTHPKHGYSYLISTSTGEPVISSKKLKVMFETVSKMAEGDVDTLVKKGLPRALACPDCGGKCKGENFGCNKCSGEVQTEVYTYKGYTIKLPWLSAFNSYSVRLYKDGKYVLGVLGPVSPKLETAKKEAEKMVDAQSETLSGVHQPMFLSADSKPVQSTKGYVLPGEIGKLIQRINPYRFAIALTGPKGGGKTQVTFQIAEAFATAIKSGKVESLKNKEVAIFSLEQGGLESIDTVEAVDRHISPANRSIIKITGEKEKGIDTIKEVAASGSFGVIIIDSWQKLNVPSTRFDELRQEFPDIIWVVIFQQNSEGGTRGGVASEYDANVVLKIHKVDKSFVRNWVELDKNRTSGNRLDLHYMIADKKTVEGECPEEQEEHV